MLTHPLARCAGCTTASQYEITVNVNFAVFYWSADGTKTRSKGYVTDSEITGAWAASRGPLLAAASKLLTLLFNPV